MGAIFGRGMHIAVEATGRYRYAGDRIGREALLERRFHLGNTEDLWSGAGDRNPHRAVGKLGDHDADHGIARGRIGELGITRPLRCRKLDRGHDLIVGKCRFEHAGEELVA